MVARIEVDMPMKFGAEARIVLRLRDKELVGSRNHFVRFDLYTTYAPSHPDRHLGYWDIALHTIKQARTAFLFRDGQLYKEGHSGGDGFQKAWKGRLEPRGYCSFQVSLQEYTWRTYVQRESKTWDVVFWQPGMDLPLECIMIPLTQRCNLKCPMCPRQNSVHLEKADVSEDVLAPLLEAASHYVYAGLQGLGEPLLNPDLFRIAAEFKRRMPSESVLATTTNGMFLTPDASRKLIDLGLNSLVVSLDGASKDVYEALRPGADFDVVTRNVAYAINYGRKSGRKRLWFSANFVTHPENLVEIPTFMEFINNLGIQAVAFIHMRNMKTGEIHTWDEEKLAALFNEARELGERYGIRVVAPLIRRVDDRRCVFMQSSNVWLSGDVVPCLRMEPDGSPWPIKIFGNVRHKPLHEIWNSPEYKEFRSQVLSGDYPEVCQDCNFCDGRVT